MIKNDRAVELFNNKAKYKQEFKELNKEYLAARKIFNSLGAKVDKLADELKQATYFVEIYKGAAIKSFGNGFAAVDFQKYRRGADVYRTCYYTNKDREYGVRLNDSNKLHRQVYFTIVKGRNSAKISKQIALDWIVDGTIPEDK